MTLVDDDDLVIHDEIEKSSVPGIIFNEDRVDGHDANATRNRYADIDGEIDIARAWPLCQDRLANPSTLFCRKSYIGGAAFTCLASLLIALAFTLSLLALTLIVLRLALPIFRLPLTNGFIFASFALGLTSLALLFRLILLALPVLFAPVPALFALLTSLADRSLLLSLFSLALLPSLLSLVLLASLIGRGLALRLALCAAITARSLLRHSLRSDEHSAGQQCGT